MLAHSFGDVVLWRLLVFGLQSRWSLAVGAHGRTVLFIILHVWEQRKDGSGSQFLLRGMLPAT